MTAVHQLLPTASPHDAITEQAFVWQDLLRRWGHESEIVAEHVHRDVAGAVRQADRAGKRLVSKSGLVLHYASWSATVDVALRGSGPLAVYYHNVTPGHLLRDFNPEVAEACDRGRDSLPVFQGRTAAMMAASSFSAANAACSSARFRVFGVRTAIPASAAKACTGVGRSCLPRPAGRGGCE